MQIKGAIFWTVSLFISDIVILETISTKMKSLIHVVESLNTILRYFGWVY